MPTYVYKFVDTGETIEVQQAFTENALTEAPHPVDGTLRPVRKVFLPVGITFKGNGFYKTDNRGAKSSSSGSASTSTSASSSSDSSGSSSPSSDLVGLQLRFRYELVVGVVVGFLVGSSDRRVEQLVERRPQPRTRPLPFPRRPHPHALIPRPRLGLARS